MSSWVGSDYDRISGPHAKIGSAALDHLVLHGHERVLEVGCGSGRARADMLDYIVTPYLRPATGLPDDDLYRLAGAAADRLGWLAIDYVRLNVFARRG